MRWQRQSRAAAQTPGDQIPPIALQELVQRHAAGFGRVRASGDWSDTAFRRHAGPILLGFARRVHLLPIRWGQAAGSMLAEGLARCAEDLLNEAGRYPPGRGADAAAADLTASQHEAHGRDRWQCAVVLHALAPLVAAGASSMKVIVEPDIEIDLFGLPLSDQLADAHAARVRASRGSINGYRVEAIAGHEDRVLGVALLLRAVPAEVLRHLAAPDAGWLAWASGLRDRDASGSGFTAAAVSTNALATAGGTCSPLQALLPVAVRIRQSMLALIGEGRWAVNRKRARLWHLDGALFLVWKTAASELLAFPDADQFDPCSLLQTMIDAGIVQGRPDGSALCTIATPYSARLEVVELTDPRGWLRAVPLPISAPAAGRATAPVESTAMPHQHRRHDEMQ